MFKLTSILFLFLLATNVNAITVGEITNPLNNYLNCENLKWYEFFKKNVVCKGLAKRVNDKLDKKGISFVNGNVAFSVSNFITPKQLDTGSSCSHRAWVQDNYATATLSSSGKLDLNFKSLSKPALLFVELPVNVYARINLKEQWGYRVFGSCNKIADDRYYADASAETTAYTRVMVSLEPRIEKLKNGDSQLIIEPIIDVTSGFSELNIDFNFHGKSILNGLASMITAGLGGPFRLLEAVISGDSMRDKLKDLGVEFLAGFAQFMQSLDQYILNDLLLDAVKETAEKKANGSLDKVSNKIEADIKAQVADALGLDSNGRRAITINEHLAHLIF